MPSYLCRLAARFLVGPPGVSSALMCNPYANQLRFRLTDFDKIPRFAHGIYGIWYRAHCVYVGQAARQTIADRLRQHWRKTHSEKLQMWIDAEGANLRVAYLAVADAGRIDAYERLFIKRFQPLANDKLKD